METSTKIYNSTIVIGHKGHMYQTTKVSRNYFEQLTLLSKEYENIK